MHSDDTLSCGFWNCQICLHVTPPETDPVYETMPKYEVANNSEHLLHLSTETQPCELVKEK